MRTKVCKFVFALFMSVAVLSFSVPQAMALFGTDMPYGERITDDRFPAVVRIWQEGAQGRICSGVLISPRMVLTAAHCAPLHFGEIHDSLWHYYDSGDPDEARHDNLRFSFVGYPEQDSRCFNRTSESLSGQSL